MTTNHRTYSELSQYATFEDRFHYLQLHGAVRHDTFGFDRYLNQDFYQSREWRMFRDKIIVRDMGCDLGVPDHEITDWVIRNGKIIRPTHKAIHYGDDSILEPAFTERRPGDTCLWKQRTI